MAEKSEGMLSPYRVLDLADESGLLCGKLLGDLGADVIKIEKPGGDPARNLGPFYHDEPDPEKSLFWFSYNNSKRGITLNLETSDGQEIFRRLVKTADFVIETFPPGYLGKLGLGYKALEKINPGVILVSITPFGQTGPWKNYRAPDIVAWAVGGESYSWGDADRPPVKVSYHSHAYLYASLDAAVGAMMALYYRRVTGEGQQISVSIQGSMVQTSPAVTTLWDQQKKIRRRGELEPGAISRLTEIWPCQDGLVMWHFSRGAIGKRTNLSAVQWLGDEGLADDFLKGFDWDSFEMTTTTQEVVSRVEAPVARLFRSHTKNELFRAAAKYSLELYPVATTKDILEDVQLASREFFVKLEHPELGVAIPYPGGIVKASKASPKITRRAPLVGEHNQEIYEKELGISREELVILKQAGVI